LTSSTGRPARRGCRQRGVPILVTNLLEDGLATKISNS
jgi:hypothetical protein